MMEILRELIFMETRDSKISREFNFADQNVVLLFRHIMFQKNLKNYRKINIFFKSKKGNLISRIGMVGIFCRNLISQMKEI